MTGLAYDETGDRLSPTHANKNDRRYRYYISKRLMHQTGSTADGWRLPAKELEVSVLGIVCDFLKDELRIVEALKLNDMPPNRLRGAASRAAASADELRDGAPERQRQIVAALIHQITLHADSMCIEIKRSGLGGLLAEPGAHKFQQSEGLFSLVVPMQMQRRGVEAKLVMQTAVGRSSSPDPRLVTLFPDAHRWMDDLARGRVVGVRQLARQNSRDVAEVSRTLPLAFLAPDIVEAVLGGRQPINLTPRQLKRITGLPCRWDDQRRRLGFRP